MRRNVPASARGPALGQSQSMFLTFFGANKPDIYLSVLLNTTTEVLPQLRVFKPLCLLLHCGDGEKRHRYTQLAIQRNVSGNFDKKFLLFFSNRRRVKIEGHFPDIKISLPDSFKCCSPSMIWRREQRLGRKIAFGRGEEALLSPVEIPSRFGCILCVCVFDNQSLYAHRVFSKNKGQQKSSSWKWTALYRR